MHSSKTVVVSSSDEERLVVQGFRGGPTTEEPYVFVGILVGESLVEELTLSVENANILGEYLRQEAEWAAFPRDTLEE